MKKVIFLMLVIVLSASCSNKEKEFDLHLSAAYDEMAMAAEASGSVCNNVAEAWRDIIFSNYNSFNMEKMSEHVNNAVGEIYEGLEKEGVLDSISLHQQRMQVETSLMRDAPESRKECYDDFMDMATDVNTLVRMATNPQGSFQSYVNEKNECMKNLQEKADRFKMKYGVFLRGK